MKVEGLRAGAAWAQSSHLGHSQLTFYLFFFRNSKPFELQWVNIHFYAVIIC